LVLRKMITAGLITLVFGWGAGVWSQSTPAYRDARKPGRIGIGMHHTAGSGSIGGGASKKQINATSSPIRIGVENIAGSGSKTQADELSAGKLPSGLANSPPQPGQPAVIAPDGKKAIYRLRLHHDDLIYKGFFNPQGTRIVTCSRDKSAVVWDARSGRALFRFKNRDANGIPHAQFSPDGRKIVTANGYDNTATVWNLENGAPVAVLKGHTAHVGYAAFGPDSQTVVTASDDKAAIFWNADTGAYVFKMKNHEELRKACISPDGRRIVALTKWGGQYTVWDASTRKFLFFVGFPYKHSAQDVVISPDGRMIVTCGEDAMASARANLERAKAELPSGQKGAGHNLKLAQDYFDKLFPPGQKQTPGPTYGHVVFWDAVDGHILQQISEKYLRSRRLGISNDGRRLFTIGSGNGYHVSIWEVASGREIAHLRHRSDLYDCRFSPDGKLLLTCSDNHVRLWDSRSGKLVQVFDGHERTVLTADFHPLAQEVLSVDAGGTALVWPVTRQPARP
jgi:WD40 repeat protein